MADYPCNFVYHPVTKTLSWDGVLNSLEYLVTSSDNSSGQPYEVIYQGGTDTSCPYDKSPGTYYLRGKARPTSGSWGVWGALEAVIVV